MCTVNRSVHTKKVWKLIECTLYEGKLLSCPITFYQQVVLRIQTSKLNVIAIQLDETTDTAKLAQLCVHIGYICKKPLLEESLFGESRDTKATAEDIFSKVSRFF